MTHHLYDTCKSFIGNNIYFDILYPRAHAFCTMAFNGRKRLSDRLVGVSLKMYFDLPSTEAYLNALSTAYSASPPTCNIFVLPSLPAISIASTIFSSNAQVWVGAQNCHWEDSGAHTGEVSPLMLKQLGCTIVEIGHAERRRAPFNETDEITANKAKAAVRNDLIPLICIGEKLKSTIVSQGVGLALRECVPQVMAVLNAVSDDADLIFAYEPIWAIGAQEPASADHVLAVVGELRKKVWERGRNGKVRFLYGGSAKPGTWDSLKGVLDGLFLGRFAHDVDAFKRVVEEISAD